MSELKYPDDFINKIICGDCLEVMKQIPEASVDLIVTSPPYNLRNSSGGWAKAGLNSKSKWENAQLKKGYSDHQDNMPHEDYVYWQRACLSEMMRVLKDDGAIFYNHKWRVQNGLLQDRQDILSGFPVRQIIIWQRSGGINFNPGYFLPTYEVIYLIAKPKFKLTEKANTLGDVWYVTQESKNPHPAPFPEELAEKCIGSTYAKIILDPFNGSGTTPYVSKKLGRNYIGIDSSKEYCEMSEKRLRGEVWRQKKIDSTEYVSENIKKLMQDFPEIDFNNLDN